VPYFRQQKLSRDKSDYLAKNKTVAMALMHVMNCNTTTIWLWFSQKSKSIWKYV